MPEHEPSHPEAAPATVNAPSLHESVVCAVSQVCELARIADAAYSERLKREEPEYPDEKVQARAIVERLMGLLDMVTVCADGGRFRLEIAGGDGAMTEVGFIPFGKKAREMPDAEPRERIDGDSFIITLRPPFSGSTKITLNRVA